MNRNKDGSITLDTRGIPVRIGLAALTFILLVVVWYAVSWQIGNLIADLANPTDPNAAGVADLATSFSPRDPLTQWLMATLEQDKSVQSVGGFEKTVRLSPSDYRWWIQLGRAYEQADQSSKAEAAFKYAIDLAPNYVLPQWQAGNFYMRLGREADGFAALKKAAERDVVYREQVYSVVWDYYDQDPAKLDELTGKNQEVISGLARFYAVKRIPDKSLEAWNRLTQAERDKNKPLARLIMQAFYDTGFFRTSVKFAAGLDTEKGAGVGRIYNGGFESEILPADQALFSWKMAKVEDMRVQTNSFKKHGGKRSLELSFSGFEKPVIYNVYQTVAVDSGAKYSLSFWYKTENLASKGMPLIEVTNAADGSVISFSNPIPPGTNDWQKMTLEFTVPADAEGVAIRTNREYCGESCLLTGSLLYDDFELLKIK